MGPNFGSGAYTQKQKVGVLEEMQPAQNNQSQSLYNSRKSSAINSFHRRSNYKSFHNSGADQFENRVNVLEELVYQVHKDVFFKRVKKNQQIKDLVINFEDSLKKII